MKRTWVAVLAVVVVGSLGLGAWAVGVGAADPMNDKCPLSGKAIDKGASSEVKVAFCCMNCKGKFDKDPAPLLNKVDKLPNEKCPASGKAVDAEATSTVSVAFCCMNCKGKFDKDPASFLSKVKGIEKK